MQAAASMPILIHTNPTRGTNNTGGDINMLVGSGDTGHGGNMTLTSGDTVDARHRGGFLTLTAGGNNNTVGGRRTKVTGGFAGGTTDCDLDYYECGGLNITVAMYEAVLHGCTADAGTAASSAFLCGTMEVTAAQRTAVLGGCTQKCLGGAVEVSGGLSSGGVGGAVVVTGGATSSTDPYARGGHVEVRGGTAALGSGGAVLLSSGRSAQRHGEVLVRTETSGNDGVSGEISVETGASAVGDSGGITLATGSAMTGAGGDVNLLVGSGDTENGGAVVIKAGESHADSKKGGGVFITSGAGTSAQEGSGGELVMMAGNAEGSLAGDGGRVEIRGGKAVGGRGGDVAVSGGNSYSGDGGALILQGGSSETGTGGDVILDAGESGTHEESKEGMIRIAPTSASYVRIGRSGSKTVRTDVFGDLTVHGSFVSTNSMVFQDTYAERVHVSQEQDLVIQEETRVPKITGLDSEDVSATPTSTLTLDAGQGGSDQWIEIGPWEAEYITIGGKNNNASHGARDQSALLLRQGYDEADKRLQMNRTGAILMQAAASMPILIHTNPTRGTNNTGGDINMLVGSGDTGHGGNMTLTSGDTVDARHRGGFLTLTAGGNNNTVGGRGGVVKVTGGFAGGTTDCDLDYYECGGLNITVAMYEAVLHGCTADAGTAASSAFLCGTMEVTAAQRTAVLGGCTQKCLGGAVEVSGGLSSGGVGGAVVVTGGATSSTDPYARGGNVEVRGGTAALGSGGAVLLSSGRSAQRSSGEVLVRTETSGNDGVSGEISVETGASAVGDSGGITLATGSAMTGAGGDVNLLVGSGDTENGGAVVIKAGESHADSKKGGGVFITSGAGTSAQEGSGGELVMMAGNAEGSLAGDGGRVEIRGGKAVGGRGGDVAVSGGNSYSGDGGALILQGGSSETGTGGDVILDAGESGTHEESKEGMIRIAPTSASYVRIGRSGSKTVRTDVFGDLTVHGSFVSTNSMVFQDTYAERVHVSQEQDLVIQEETRVPKITGLDSEDVSATPTSTLTLDAGQGGSDQWIEIGPWEAEYITIGGKNNNASHGARDQSALLLRQGYDEADKRLQMNRTGAILMQAAASMPILIHTNPTRGTNNTGGDINMLVGSGDTGHGGNMTLTSGDTVDARHRGGFLTLTAGGNNNTVGGRGGVVKVTGGFAGGTTDCDLDYYECGGLNITVAMYEAVLHGCTADAGTAASSIPCGTMEVTAAQRTAVLGGCTQKCLGGAVEVSGGLSSGGVGGAVVVTGGATSSTDPYARGGNVEVRGGTAALGSGGAVLLSSGRSAQRSSGEVLVRTETSGNDGVSGEISVETGASAVGDSGGITLATGSAMTGAGGDVNLLVGSGDTENGGAVVIKAGESHADSKKGGGVFITSGAGTSAQEGSGGELVMMAGNAEGQLGWRRRPS